MKNFIAVTCFSGLLLSACAYQSQQPQKQSQTQYQSSHNRPKNIILMIGDGMGPGVIKAYRKLKDNPQTPFEERLLLDEFLVGSLNTNSIDPDEAITDSAASATAYATGYKTANKVLSVDPQNRPLLTVLEQAKMNGESTGLVVTSELAHATPAAFASHVPSRKQMHQIANQYFDNQYNHQPMVDVMLGGGQVDFKRVDRDLTEEFIAAGYQFIDNRQALLASKETRLLGIFASFGLPKMLDRGEQTPSLAEMTNVAIDRLSKNEKGFFLMVEGSQIDWAAHDNDIVGVASEMEDFLRAVKVVIDFAKQQQDTLVIITADHVTGGLSVGSRTSGEEHYYWDRDLINRFRYTPEKMVLDAQVSHDLVAEFHKATPMHLTKKEIQILKNADVNDTEKTLRKVAGIINRRTYTGWTSNGHTGEDVYLYAFGPQSEQLHGYWDNTKIGQFIFELLRDESKN